MPEVTNSESHDQALLSWYEHVVESTGPEVNYFAGAFDGYIDAGQFALASQVCDTLGLARLPGWREAIGTAPDQAVDALMQEHLRLLEEAFTTCIAAGGDVDALRAAAYQLIDAKALLQQLESRIGYSAG